MCTVQAAPHPTAVVTQIDTADDKSNVDKVLELVLAELKKLSAVMLNTQALVQEMRHQNDIMQQLLSQMKMMILPGIQDLPTGVIEIKIAWDMNKDARAQYGSKDRFGGRLFSRDRNRSISNDCGNSYSWSNSNNRSRSDNIQTGQQFSDRTFNDQKRPAWDKSFSADRHRNDTYLMLNSPHPSRSPSLLRGNSPRRVTFENQGKSR